MKINEIPLTPTNQQFTIKLSDTVWQFRLIWHDSAGWVLDMLTVDNQPVIQGIPLILSENLLTQYSHLIPEGKLVLLSDEESDIKANTLGTTVKLYWIT
uniref:Cyanophage baseplate Pam3 plug gp18 domain-containing protein n=1 Tax=Arsenophonus endosymbiont of Trialeurodes vaporariorum TaxID=235567 RepID=A0A3B0MLI9_9GAMM